MSLPLSPPTDPTIAILSHILSSETHPLAPRFRALFALKALASTSSPTPPPPTPTATPYPAPALATHPAIAAIAAAFATPSALLKHELAYCLGQTRNLAAAPYLQRVLRDRTEDAMVRHEAAEALGALGDTGSLELLRERRDDGGEEEVVRETCEIAVGRVEWEWEGSRRATREEVRRSDFASVDPAPALLLPRTERAPDVKGLQSTLLDTEVPLFQRYRAMFALRDLASPPDLPTAEPAVLALAAGFADPSALFRHEIAFVFGQLRHPASIPSLVETLANTKEASMVRHEAAEALGSLGDEPGVEEILRGFLDDPEQVVRESVVVALDMAEYEKSGEREYAVVPEISGINGFSPLAAVKA